MSAFTEFRVRVEEMTDGWAVDVYDLTPGDFARVQARELHVALRMALAYMECAAEPNPFDLIGEKNDA